MTGKFKVGDKVKILSKNAGGHASICTTTPIGSVGYITRSEFDYYMVDSEKGTNRGNFFLESDLELYTGLEVGDVLYKRNSTTKRTVIAVFEHEGKNYAVTQFGTGAALFVNKVEYLLSGAGYEVKGAETELTLQEIADKFDIDVKTLRIKD